MSIPGSRRALLSLTVIFGLALLAIRVQSQSSSPLQVGYAVIKVEEGSSPVATALFSIRNGEGTLVSEAGVAAVEPIQQGRIFVDAATPTGLALANPSDEAVTATLTLRDAAGTEVSQRQLTIGAGEHQARFVFEQELFGPLPEGFIGSATFETIAPDSGGLAAVTIRQSTNAHGESLLATLPVANLAAESPQNALVPSENSTQPEGSVPSLIFPHLGAGGGLLSTQIILINPTGEPLSGEIQLIGSDGQPLRLELDGEMRSTFAYALAPDGVFQAKLTSPAGVVTGYAVVTVSEGNAAPSGTAIFQIRDGDSGPLVSEAGVGAIVPTTRAHIFVDTVATRTGVALARPGNDPAEVTLRLLDRNGLEFDHATTELVANSHLSKFVDVLFERPLPVGFTGVLEIVSAVPIVPITLKLTVNGRDDQILTALPVADLERSIQSKTLVFPHVVFGQFKQGAEVFEFFTRLILLNPDVDGPSGGLLRFTTSGGNPLVVPLVGDEKSEFSYELPEGGGQQLRPGNRAEANSIVVQVTQNSEIVINQGNRISLSPIVLDTAGQLRDDFPFTFTSIDPEKASADSFGRITANQVGFSTLTVSAGEKVLVLTVNVVGEDFGGADFQITGISRDSVGRLYLVDEADHSVLLAERLGETPEIYAGVEARPGFRDDLRLTARFNRPAYLALDKSSGRPRLYVSDSDNHLIRVVSPGPEGRVATLAGLVDEAGLSGMAGSQDGTLSEARFRNPQGVALDDLGRLWVADTGNHTIRLITFQIDPSKGTVQGTVRTVAGLADNPGNADRTGNQARFRSPVGIALERELPDEAEARNRRGGELPPVRMIVADTGNGLLRRVTEDGEVTTLSAGVSPAAGPSGAPTNPSFGTAVRTFSAPVGVAVGPLGTVYVTEPGSGNVRALLRNGSLTEVAQAGTFSTPMGIVISGTGRVLVTDSEGARQIQFGTPEVDQVIPREVRIDGGEILTLAGGNFAPESLVVVAGEVVLAEIVNTRTIQVLLPEGLSSGRSTVTVQTRGGIAQAPITVLPPRLEELSEGEITTIAGGSTFIGDGSPAEDAAVRGPTGMTVSLDGSLYFSDTDHQRVRRIDALTGIITTVAGIGDLPENLGEDLADGLLAVAAPLAFPRGVAFDSAGNLYIVEEASHRVRKVDAASGRITTVAGGGKVNRTESDPAGLGDGGPAIDAVLNGPRGIAIGADGSLYIGDTANQRIRLVNLETGIISTLAGNGTPRFSGDHGPAGRATLSSPSGLALDRLGNLYVADTFNNRIRRIHSSGIITTVVGPESVPLIAPNGISSQGGEPEPKFEPRAVAVDVAGNLLIADTSKDRILFFDIQSGELRTIAGNGRQNSSGEASSWKRSRSETAEALEARLSFPNGVVADGSGNIFIADTGNGRVRRLPPGEKIILIVAGNGRDAFIGDGEPAVAASLRYPSDIAKDDSGNLFIADTSNHRIRRVQASSSIIDTLAGTGRPGFSGDEGAANEARLSYPGAVAVDNAGSVLIADTDNHRIRLVDPATETISSLLQDAGALRFPRGIDVDSTGNLLIGDTGHNRIWRLNPFQPVLETVAGTGERGSDPEQGLARLARFYAPRGVALDRFGNLFIADTFNHRVRKVDAESGLISTFAGEGNPGFQGDGGPATSARLDTPIGLATDDGGHLFIADTFNQRIRRVDAVSGHITTVAGVDDFGFSGDGGPATETRLSFPTGVALDREGNLLIADRNNHRIRAVKGVGISGSTDPQIPVTPVSLIALPSPVNVGQILTLQIGITNPFGTGATARVEVPVDETEVALVSMFTSQGDCGFEDEVVICDLGILEIDGIADVFLELLVQDIAGIGPQVNEIAADMVFLTQTVSLDFSVDGTPSTFGSSITTPVRPANEADLAVQKIAPRALSFPSRHTTRSRWTIKGPPGPPA